MNNQETTLDKKIANIPTVTAFSGIKGSSFVGIRGYESSKGEVSNVTLNVGGSYGKLLESDLKTLEEFDIAPLCKVFNKDVVLKAHTALLTSLYKRTASELEKEVLRANNDKTIKRSDAQKDAFITISKGLKHKDNVLYVEGTVTQKTVLIKGVYPTVKSRELTIVKNRIKKDANLKENKYKRFVIKQADSIKVKGFEIK